MGYAPVTWDQYRVCMLLENVGGGSFVAHPRCIMRGMACETNMVGFQGRGVVAEDFVTGSKGECQEYIDKAKRVDTDERYEILVAKYEVVIEHLVEVGRRRRLEEMGSTNGTYTNSTELDRRRLGTDIIGNIKTGIEVASEVGDALRGDPYALTKRAVNWGFQYGCSAIGTAITGGVCAVACTGLCKVAGYLARPLIDWVVNKVAPVVKKVINTVKKAATKFISWVGRGIKSFFSGWRRRLLRLKWTEESIMKKSVHMWGHTLALGTAA